jgi:hypothetical protein
MSVFIKHKVPPKVPTYTVAQFNAKLEWEAAAENAVIAYAVKMNGETFTIESVRFANPKLKTPDDDERAWGGIVDRVKNKGIIEHAGTERVLSSRMGFKSLWRLSKNFMGSK